jgi:hypothetical protein
MTKLLNVPAAEQIEQSSVRGRGFVALSISQMAVDAIRRDEAREIRRSGVLFASR